MNGPDKQLLGAVVACDYKYPFVFIFGSKFESIFVGKALFYKQ